MVVIQCTGWDSEKAIPCRGGWWLRFELEKRLGQPLHLWVADLFVDVCHRLGKPDDSLANAQIRIIQDANPKLGYAYKAVFQNRHGGKSTDSIVDMTIGYSGDIVEFEKTLIHEALHLLNYDEEVVEARTQKIFRQRLSKEIK